MSEYSIERTDFEKQKNELKLFAEQPATSTELDKFSTGGKFSDFLSGGLLGLIDHKVTGEEMNKLVTELQTCFSEINERDRKVIKEFGEVYETFEALDKGYIQGILISVESAKKASEEAKSAQKDADVALNALKLTVKKLKEFKSKVESYTHLNDIDDMWIDLDDLKITFEKMSSEIDRHKELLDIRIKKLEEYKDFLLKLSHLKDVDEMWSKLNESLASIEKVEGSVEEILNTISEINVSFIEYKDKLDCISHLKDVDELWDLVQTLNLTLSERVVKLTQRMEDIHSSIETIKTFSTSQKHFSDVDNMWERVCDVEKKIHNYEKSIGEVKSAHQNLDNSVNELKSTVDSIERQEHLQEIDIEWEYSHDLGVKIDEGEKRIAGYERTVQLFEEKIQIMENENKLLKHKLSIAFIVAGSAVGLSAIQLILSILGII